MNFSLERARSRRAHEREKGNTSAVLHVNNPISRYALDPEIVRNLVSRVSARR